jgi:DNA-binding LacI/PurR family transcriptional regulator
MKPKGIRAKTVTIRDVAEAAGTTIATVSKVFHNTGNISPGLSLTVRAAAQSLNYEPNPHAQSLSGGRSYKSIALLSLTLDLGTGTRKLRSIQGQLAQLGFDVPIYAYGFGTLAEMEQLALTMIRTLRRQRPRVIVCNINGLSGRALDELKHYQEEGGLVVCYDHATELDCDKVIFDRENNGYQAARHLLELGHRTLGLCIPGVTKPQDSYFEGFRRALHEWDIEVRDEWLFGSHTYSVNCGLYEEAGEQLADSFLQLEERPSALCIGNDSTAVAFVATLAKAGLHVPNEVSIVGNDDSPIALYGAVTLTTVSHPVELIVQHVVQMVTSRVQESYDGPARCVDIKGDLIERQSTQPFCVNPAVAESTGTSAPNANNLKPSDLLKGQVNGDHTLPAQAQTSNLSGV